MEEPKAQAQAQHPMQGLGGPMTRARAKKSQEALNQLVNSLLEAQHQQDSASLNSKVINCLIQDEELGVENPNGATEEIA